MQKICEFFLFASSSCFISSSLYREIQKLLLPAPEIRLCWIASFVSVFLGIGDDETQISGDNLSHGEGSFPGTLVVRFIKQLTC